MSGEIRKRNVKTVKGMDNERTSRRGRSWVEIDPAALANNCEIFRAGLPAGVDVMAVVKADAYGHGDRAVVKLLSARGIRHFAVSNVDEAIRVREAGAEGMILILGYTPVDRAAELAKYGITQALLSEEYAAALRAAGFPVRCHFALDTGMRRIGLNADDPAECERVIRAYADMLTGVFTHLCVADTPSQDAFTRGQIAKFEAVCARIADLKLPYCHCLNSAGGLWYNDAPSRLARLGIVLYGLKPDYANTLPDGIRPALAWKSAVSMVKTVKPGDTIGYGRTFTVTHPMTVATIPTGYADGYPRLLSGKGCVLVNGRRAPLAGRVCMDQMVADVTGIPGVEMGTEVTLIGHSGDEVLTADDLAEAIGTIGYEIVCGITARVDRIYI